MQRAFTNTKHIESERRERGGTRGGPPLVDADWHVFCQAICTGKNGKSGKSFSFTTEN